MDSSSGKSEPADIGRYPLSSSPEVVAAESSGILIPNAGGAWGFHFDDSLEERLSGTTRRAAGAALAVAMALLMAVIVLLKSRNLVSFWYGPLWQAYSLLASAYVLSRVVISVLYRVPKDRGFLKPVTIIVAVKNEEAHIEEVVRRCFSARYPEDLMEVIVVDDGSTDGTWAVLQKLIEGNPRLQIHRFAKNRGKRHAMALGAQKAKGEILIYIDSDSMVEPEALYRIVQPFHDPHVGAVSGHTLVIVEPENHISKIEAVRYYLSYRIMKAAESVFGAVTCCPGPFSAYRKEAVLRVLPRWQNQMFLGAAATFGDDRSLTNCILPDYRVVYHAGARCSTYAPQDWKTYFKQQLRWKKSWVRETTIAGRRMWREHPAAAAAYYLSVLVTLLSPLVVIEALVFAPMTCLPYLLGLLLVFLLLGLLFYYHTRSKYWYWGLVFAAVYSWLFSLQTYYAIATVRRNHWGTR
jgi:hyaluronan synthase